MTNGEGQSRGKSALALLGLVASACGSGRSSLPLLPEQADTLRDAVIRWAYGHETVGSLLVVDACVSATGLAAWLVRRFSPQASGSGIPHVEAVVRGELPQAPFRRLILAPVEPRAGLRRRDQSERLGRPCFARRHSRRLPDFLVCDRPKHTQGKRQCRWDRWGRE